MTKEEAVNKGFALINRSTFAMLGSNGNEGYPNIKAMFKMENQGLTEIWFSTNTSSKRVERLKENPKACVYFTDFEKFEGLMLYWRNSGASGRRIKKKTLERRK